MKMHKPVTTNSLSTAKNLLTDIWPINKKRFLVHVDFNVKIKEGIVENDWRIRMALPTIRHIVSQGGIAILMSHNGRPKGISETVTKTTQCDLMEAWEEENGRGLTNYFGDLSGSDKLQVLKGDPKAPKMSASRGSGKTEYFSALPLEGKLVLLDSFTEKSKRTSDRAMYEVETSLQSVAKLLQTMFPNNKVHFAQDPMHADDIVKDLQPGDICVLENLLVYHNERSDAEEERIGMARQLATYGDYYVLDSFRLMNRVCASITELPRIMKHGVCGLLMEAELKGITPGVANTKNDIAVVLGGNNAAEMVEILELVIHRIRILLLCGTLGTLFLKAKGIFMGSTVIDLTLIPRAKELMSRAEKLGVKIILPVDHWVSKDLDPESVGTLTRDETVPDGLSVYDIGSQSVELFAKTLKKCNTAIWTGAAGVAERDPFHEGTVGLAKALTQPNIYSIVGGRTVTTIIEEYGYSSAISHISTGSSVLLRALSTFTFLSTCVLTDRGSLEYLNQFVEPVKDLIKRLSLFKSCSDSVLKAVAKKFTRCEYKEGDVLICEGDSYWSMWVIESGHLLLSNKQGVSHIAIAGDTIGMPRFLRNDRSEFRVQTTTPVVGYYLTFGAFVELCRTTSNLSLELAENMLELQRASSSSTMWYDIASNSERSPNPNGVTSLPQHRIGVSMALAEATTQIASDLVSQAVLGNLSLKSFVDTIRVIGGLHIMFHPIRSFLAMITQVGSCPNPFLRILISQHAVALSSGFVSLYSRDLGVTWMKMNLKSLMSQMLSGMLHTRKHLLNLLLSLIATIGITLAFAPKGIPTDNAMKRIIVTTVAYLLLQRPSHSMINKIIDVVGLPSSDLQHKDF